MLSESEVERVRDELYRLAELTLETLRSATEGRRAEDEE